MSGIVVSPLKTLDKAVGALRGLGLLPEAQQDQAPVVALIGQVAEFSEEKAIAIARTLSQMSWFNEIVRQEISDISIGERYKGITENFDSIRDDTKRMVDQLEDGTIDTGEKLANLWMKLTRGSISNRFQEIKETYLDVSEGTGSQIERERRIIGAYQDFREALKECQVLVYELLESASTHLDVARENLQTASTALETPPDDAAERSRLELTRDQRLRDLQEVDKKYQIAKDLADNMSISYNTTEIVMARLVQTTQAKERVYAQSVTFFGTNESVFTALNASITSLQGLHESTQTLEAMKDGADRSLETLADVGDRVQTDGLKAGYGPTIKAESVRRLVDAVINYQSTATRIVEEMREAATQNAAEIHGIVEDGKRRMIALRRHLPS